jgi:hypothetical protein
MGYDKCQTGGRGGQIPRLYSQEEYDALANALQEKFGDQVFLEKL